MAVNYNFSHFSREIFDAENPERVENQFPKSLLKQVIGLAYKFDPFQKWSTTLFGKIYSINAQGSKQYDFGLPTQHTDAFEASKTTLGMDLPPPIFYSRISS